ncbi:cysteine dioxygenase [Microbispora sp. NPDC049125]|uniref:cysteine dioxygenase family protein n=1 Tax=Microbispora sp. NPDC049125 TaxID=3154929 RepID=UPI003465B6CF
MTLLSRPPSTASGLDELATGIRAALSRRDDWRRTAQRVASVLRRHLPSPEVLTGIPPGVHSGAHPGVQEDPRGRLLHVEPDGAFSIQAIVWPAGRITRIHDHVTWCVFGVIQGAVDEELFTLGSGGDVLVPAGRTTNATGAVTGFAPPGDIHRVANTGDGTAVTIHVYGTDLSRIGSSALRFYDLPVGP